MLLIDTDICSYAIRPKSNNTKHFENVPGLKLESWV
jgi:predicted nucleic acid-binding protein